PAAESVQSVRAYRSILDVPGPVDLAVIAVPAAEVLRIVEECIASGVQALVVIPAGFAEVGEAGRARQEQLVVACRKAGVRLVGPNCIGLINPDPNVRLNAPFGPHPPPAGHIGFLSQSGALGLAAIDYARSRGLGISTFISVGNKADVSGNDLL